MKDKDKQMIEELAKCMGSCQRTCDECFERFERVMTMKIKNREKHCQVYMYAKRAVEAGYRKIDKDSVVIPNKITEKTSAEDIIKIAKYNDKLRKQASKETAGKIFNELNEKISTLIIPNEEHNLYIVEKWEIVELAKQFGVEIDKTSNNDT